MLRQRKAATLFLLHAEGLLSPEEAARVERRLESALGAREQVAEYRSTIEALRETPAVSVPPASRQRVWAAVSARIHGQSVSPRTATGRAWRHLTVSDQRVRLAIITVTVVAGLTWCSNRAFHGPDPHAVLARAYAAQERIRDYEMTIDGGWRQIQVRQWFRQPGLLKGEFTEAGSVTGARLWLDDVVREYDARAKVVIERVRLAHERPPTMLTGTGDGMEIFRLGKEDWEASVLRRDSVLGRECDVVRVVMRPGQPTAQSVDTWIDRQTGLVLKQLLYPVAAASRRRKPPGAPAGARTSASEPVPEAVLEVRRLRLETGVPEEVFRLDLPEGVTTVRGDLDLRDLAPWSWPEVGFGSLDKMPEALESTVALLRKRMTIDWSVLCPTRIPAGHRYLTTDSRGPGGVGLEGLRTVFVNPDTGGTVVIRQCAAKRAPDGESSGAPLNLGPLRAHLSTPAKPFPRHVVTWQRGDAWLRLTDTDMLPEAELRRVIRGMRPLAKVLEEREAAKPTTDATFELVARQPWTAAQQRRTLEILAKRATSLGAKGVHAEATREGVSVACTYAGDAHRLLTALITRGRLRLIVLPRECQVQEHRGGALTVLRAGKPLPPKELLRAVQPILTEAEIVHPVELTPLTKLGSYALFIDLNDRGRQALTDCTADNVGAYLGIFLDEQLLTAPIVKEPVTGGRVALLYGCERETAEEVRVCLNAGPLPVELAPK